jgi:diguanylate cyclase (GGDEF)-like protein
VARLAAVFFALSGAIGLATRVAFAGATPEVLLGPGGVALAAGALFWVAPWDRWPRGALLAPVAAGLALKTWANAEAAVASPYIYGVHYVVLFMWVGVALPRGSALLCAPFLVVSYLLPMWQAGAAAADVASVWAVAACCVFTGEAAGWLSARLRRVERDSAGRTRTMSGLVDATLALASCQEIEELGRLTAVAARELFGGDAALVALDEERGLRAVGEAGWQEPGAATLARPEAGRLLVEALRDPDREADPAALAALASALGVAGLRVLALRGSGAPLGVALVAHVREMAVVDQFVAWVARTLATQAGLGLERVRSAQALLDESLRDPLTGVGNRRAATAALERLKPGDVVALIDLDHFKRVNDGWGHAAGDRVLRSLASFLRTSLRGPDAVYRLGGEEFLLVLPEGGAGAVGAVRRLHARWRLLERVTSFSAGVALHLPGEATERALARADAALYEAKRAGRNRVVVDARGLED